MTRTETAVSGRRLSSVESEAVISGGRGTWSLRHNDLSAVGLIPRSIEAWRSGRSKNAAIIFLVTTMGSEDARLASPAFLLGKTLQGRRVEGLSVEHKVPRNNGSSIQRLIHRKQGRRSLLRSRTGREGWRRVTNLAALAGAMRCSSCFVRVMSFQ